MGKDKQAEKAAAKDAAKQAAKAYKELRQRPQDGIEYTLRHHFEAEGPDAGFSSSFGPLTDMALAGPGGNCRDPDARLAKDHRLLRIRDHRLVASALRGIAPSQMLVLRAAYGDERLPIQVYELYGPTAGVALLTEAAKAAYAREVAKCVDAVPAVDPGLAREERERAPTAPLFPVLPAATLTKTLGARKLADRGLGEWLRSGRSKEHRDGIRAEMQALLTEAREAFRVALEAAKEERRRLRKGATKAERRPPTRFIPHPAALQPALASEGGL